MERMRPTPQAEPALPQAAGAGTLRGVVYTLLAVMLAAGVWVRFNNQIAGMAPSLAGPAAAVADQFVDTGRPVAVMELGLLPGAAAAPAVDTMGLDTADAAQLAQGLRDKKVRLIQLPLADASQDPSSASGHAVTVSSGGYTRIVHLSRRPVVVTLPISSVGTVSFRSADGYAVDIGALTLAGPVRLPELPAGHTLSVGVIAQ